MDFHPRLDISGYYAMKDRRQQEKKEKQDRKEVAEGEVTEEPYDDPLLVSPKAKIVVPSFSDTKGGGDGGDGIAVSQTSRMQTTGQGTEADDTDNNNNNKNNNNNNEVSTNAGNDGDASIVAEGSKMVIDSSKPHVDDHPGGSLQVPGANDDSKRIAKLITDSLDVKTNTSTISSIFVTLDTHHKLHIAHRHSWKKGRVGLGLVAKVEGKGAEGKPGTPEYKKAVPPLYYTEGEPPNEFITISHNDVKNGVWKPADHLDEKWCIEYTRSLEVSGKFQLQIWPEHCLIGSVGHSVVPCIANALREWSKTTRKSVEFVKVGQNIRTEAYSVFKAEVGRHFVITS